MPFTLRPSSVLACGAGLLAGLAAGWSLAQLGPPDGVQAAETAGPVVPIQESEAGPSALAASAAPLPRSASARIELSSDPAGAETPGHEAGKEELPPVQPDLVSELADFLRSGQLEQALLEGGESEIATFLTFQYIQAGEPGHALRLLERFPPDEAYLYGGVAEALRTAGDKAGAASAYLRALERDPLEPEWIDRLRELDPAGALAVLDARAADGDPVDEQLLAGRRASLLVALGRGDEARALLSDLLAQGAIDEQTLEVVREIDPQWAERELRARLGTDLEGRHALALAELLQSSGREAEGAAVLDELLARDPEQIEALSQLFQLDPERALAHLDERDLEELEPWVLSQAGAALMEQGRSGEAVELWMRSARLDLNDEAAVSALLEHAPERLWSHCREAAASTGDDELLGDVGDLYWRQGRREEALDLWRRARRLDPGDGEWREKLRAAAAGRDPL